MKSAFVIILVICGTFAEPPPPPPDADARIPTYEEYIQSVGFENEEENTVDQRLDNDGFSDPLPDGHTCMNKVMLVDQMIYDEEMRCHHIYSKSCYQTYTTVFKQAQYEKCKDMFKKSCSYEYKKIPHQHTVEICNDNLVRDCEKTDGPTVCTTEYETVCESSYSSDEVEDDVPNCEIVQEKVCKDVNGEEVCNQVPRQKCEVTQSVNAKLSKSTECKSVPREVCGPEACPVVAGPRICRDEIKTVVQEVPEEDCQMTPRKHCQTETQIIPSLEPTEECIDVPKEVCATVRVNPRKESIPVVKKWCGPIELLPETTTPNSDTTTAGSETTTSSTGETSTAPPPFRRFAGQQKKHKKHTKKDFSQLSKLVGGPIFQRGGYYAEPRDGAEIELGLDEVEGDMAAMAKRGRGSRGSARTMLQ